MHSISEQIEKLILSVVVFGQNQHRKSKTTMAAAFNVNCGTPGKVHVSVVPPSSGMIHNRNVVLVYDKSGSMSDSANPNGAEDTKLFSKNDLARRAAEIVARSLKSTDTLTIITYDSVVCTLMPATQMDASGINHAVKMINTITTGGCTALWDGLLAGLSAANAFAFTSDATIMLLTDGQPSTSPHMGEVAALKNYFASSKTQPRIHTIGFGYDINSALLADLAAVGQNGGKFLFIPDGTMVITSFVNLMASERCIIGRDMTVRFGDTEVKLGTLAYGHTRDLIFDISNPADFTWSVSYTPTDGARQVTLPAAFKEKKDPRTAAEIIRCNALKAIQAALRIGGMSLKQASAELIALISSVEVTSSSPTPPIIDDITGEVASAVHSENNWRRWGQHYMRSLITAHTTQSCTNFKDPGVQVYGGDMFKDIKTSMNTMCDALDAPVPSLRPRNDYGRGGCATGVPVYTSDQFSVMFNNVSGGCFGGHGLIKMNDGTEKRVDAIQAGDVLKGNATVKCVVTFSGPSIMEVNPPGATAPLPITPWHPIIVNGEWVFPMLYNYCKGADITSIPVDTVYNLVLDSVHIVTINGVDACTLGHGFTGEVIGHEFYGTQRVIDDLQKFPGFADGLVHLMSENQVIDPDTNVVKGYVPSPAK
jgi:hypothetical protein